MGGGKPDDLTTIDEPREPGAPDDGRYRSEVDALMADPEEWRARGLAARDEYLRAAPWPHLVTRDVFPPELLRAAEQEELLASATFVTHRTHLIMKQESSEAGGAASQAVLDAMCTPAFLAYIEALTGVTNLVADPTHAWSGVHASRPGSFSAIHRDFVHHPVTNLWHRVNVLLYLNTDWLEEYGGDLELWPENMSGCGDRVAPTAGTLVVFETHYGTLHGVPDPVRGPGQRPRLSLASYYYSEDPMPGRHHDPLIRRVRRPSDPWRMGIAEPGHILSGLLRPVYRRAPVVERAVGHLQLVVKRR
jgi:Rps23 Pro-64 3,4-dihydroxylase Tpa1-like proline 4-hydroxylase